MIRFSKTNFDVNESTEGKSVEEKMRETTINGQPIDNAAPLIYTDRKDGVLPQYDIRTDRWDIALQTTDKIARTNVAKSQDKTDNKQNEIIAEA